MKTHKNFPGRRSRRIQGPRGEKKLFCSRQQAGAESKAKSGVATSGGADWPDKSSVFHGKKVPLHPH